MKVQNQGGFLITKIHHLGGRIFAKMLKEHNVEINPGQGRILFVLWREDKISINELARRTQLGKSTLTTMLDRLEESGHIRRVSADSDRRVILIELTKKNRALEEIYNIVSHEMNQLFYRDFNLEEIMVFEAFLQRLLDNLIQAEKSQTS